MDNLERHNESVPRLDQSDDGADGCRERTWFNSDQLSGELDLCPGATNSSEDDFNTFYFYQVTININKNNSRSTRSQSIFSIRKISVASFRLAEESETIDSIADRSNRSILRTIKKPVTEKGECHIEKVKKQKNGPYQMETESESFRLDQSPSNSDLDMCQCAIVRLNQIKRSYLSLINSRT